MSPATPIRCAARATKRRRWAPTWWRFPELFIAGYPPEDLVLKPAFQAACRAAVEALARESASGGPALLVGTPWVEDGKLYNAYALLAGGAIEALRFKVDLPNYGVFDEKRVFAPGPMPGPILFQRRAPRHPDLRGHLGRRGGRVPERNRRRNPAGAERLALLARQDRAPAQHRGRARRRVRPAADLSQHGRRPGRAGVRRRLVRAQRRPQRRRAASDLARGGGADRSGGARRGGWRCVDGPMAQADESDKTDYARLRAGPARLRRQERLQGRGAGPVRRHRFRAVRRDGGGCARRGRACAA